MRGAQVLGVSLQPVRGTGHEDEVMAALGELGGEFGAESCRCPGDEGGAGVLMGFHNLLHPLDVRLKSSSSSAICNRDVAG
jgi:hypothetical protein